MRASTLAFIFILSEYSIITGGDGNCGDPPEVVNALKATNITDTRFRMQCRDGYKRQAGTSNLFLCQNNAWVNKLPLVCMRDPSLPDVTTLSHTPAPPVTQSRSSPTPPTPHVATQPEKSTSTTTRNIASTKPYTTSTTTWTSKQTSQMSTTVKETSATTSITARITTSSTTEKENLTTVSTYSPSSLRTTTTGGSGAETYFGVKTTTGITAMTLILILVAMAATAGACFWRRRSRRTHGTDVSLLMITNLPDSQKPLMDTPSIVSTPLEFTQPPVAPFRDSNQTACTDERLSA